MLVLVMVIVAIITVVAASQLFLTYSQLAASTAARDGHQARAAAMSGINRAIALLTGSAVQDATAPADPLLARYDNPDFFQAQIVTGNVERGWRFTVFADNPSDPKHVRCGVEDENGKININLATPEMLARLPGMTGELVDCLLDYIDRDSDPRPSGAEQDHYDALPRPYKIANGPLVTLEELLLVKGFTGSIVYGEDANRNGLLDPNEDDSNTSFPPDDGDGQLNTGLRTVATTITYEPNVDNAGNRRININTAGAGNIENQLRQAGLSARTATFIAQARKANVTFTDPSQLLEMTLEVPDPRDNNRKVTISSGVDAGNLAAVMDRLTCGSGAAAGRAGAAMQDMLIGRVNVNTASAAVLRALPGLSEDAAEQIVNQRGSVDSDTRSTTAWLYTENVVSAEVFKQVAPAITTRSCQFRVRSLGYHTEGRRFCVLEAMIDLASGTPRILYLRDVTKLGLPFDPSGVER